MASPKTVGKTVAYFAVAVLGVFVVLLGLIAFRFQPIDPHSPDGIRRLRLLAQTSRPVMAAIEHYHGDHGYYPAQFSDLSPAYYKQKPEWYYEGWTIRENAQQYSLSISPGPGHDPLLRFSRRADGTSQWVYDPGDGSSETPLPISIDVKPSSANSL